MRSPTPAEHPFSNSDRITHALERMGLDGAPWRVGVVGFVGYACIVLMGVLVGTAVDTADGVLFDEADVMAALSENRWAPLTDASALVGSFSDTWTVIGMASGVIVMLSVFRLGRQIVALGGGLALELSAYLTITYMVGRPRPSVDPTASLPSTPSFPSGHVAVAVVLYGGIAVVVWSLDGARSLRAGAVVVAVVLPALVAGSRVYEGLHYPSDVVAGAVLGVACLVVAMTAASHVPVATTPSKASAPDDARTRSQPGAAP